MSDIYLTIAGCLVLYVAEQVIWPMKRCHTCDGGKRWSPLNPTRNWRRCPDCDGSGRRYRTLAKLLRRQR